MPVADFLFNMGCGDGYVQDMPRLSVDIDIAYLNWTTPRNEALQAIASELNAIAYRLKKLNLKSRIIASKSLSDTKLIVEDDKNQVKVEVNVVFRGTVCPLNAECFALKLHKHLALNLTYQL